MNRNSRRILVFVLTLSVILGNVATSLAVDGFSDVPSFHWAYDEIMEAVQEGIVSGYPDGTFRPDNKVRFAEFIKMAIVAKTGKDPGPSKTGYWYSNYWDAANEAGLLNHVIAGDSEMANEITRHDAAIILADALLNQELSSLERAAAVSLFPDIDNYYNVKHFALAIKEGLMAGYPDGTFRLKQPITRAEAVSIASRLRDESKRVDVKYFQEKVVELATFIRNEGGIFTAFFTEEELESLINSKSSDIDVSEYIDEAFRLTNKEREKAGVPLLSYNHDLEKAAQAKAEDMWKNDYFDHNSPVYGTPFELINKFNITYSSAGENIAYNYRTPKEVVNGWINSPSHKENLLHKGFTDVAFGFYDGSSSGMYWVQLFIKP
ncbi:MAG: S-layer homology domain-containing protein [Anaerovoracaceae bacterium]|jgi:uncharacterized protein YkwD